MGANFVDEIKDVCNIVDVIGRVVQLKKAGENYKGVCPFHNEKTPSFVVSEKKQIFTCFGCGATGDVFEFVMRYYNLDFMQAAEKLAGDYGITIERSNSGKDKERELLYEINKEAARFFYKAMTTSRNDGYAYMQKRGITPETIQKFGIGYADGEWNSLCNYMTAKGYKEHDMYRIGLLSEKNGRYYDKFRNRVIFPIFNTKNQVIGFGGRIIGEGEPKYLNSPESPIFLKKNNLYGLNRAKSEIGKEDCAILVEGYMDVVSLHQAGICNVAASLGTALTDNQAKLLKRYSNKVILSYDADDAGRKAALRGIEILNENGISVKVLHVTDGKDPDEYVKAHGKEAFRKLLKEKALWYADYKIDNIKRKSDATTTEGRVHLLRDMVGVLKGLDPSVADMYVTKVADDMGIAPSAIRNELERAGASGGDRHEASVGQQNEPDTERSARPKTGANTRLDKTERTLIKIVLTEEEYFRDVTGVLSASKNETVRKLWDSIKAVHTNGKEIDIGLLRTELEPEESDLLNEILENEIVSGKAKQIYDDCIRYLDMENLKDRINEIADMIALSDGTATEEQIKALQTEQIECQRELQRLKEEKAKIS